MSNKEVNQEVRIELQKLSGLLSEQLALKDFDEAKQTASRLYHLNKDNSDVLSQSEKDSLGMAIKRYYRYQEQYQKAVWVLEKLSENFSEVASSLKRTLGE